MGTRSNPKMPSPVWMKNQHDDIGDSSIICKLTCFTTTEHEHYRCFPKAQPPGDLFSEPQFPPKDSETDAGAGCGT